MAKEFSAEERREWLYSLHSIPSSAAMLLENPAGHLLVVKAVYRSYWTPPGGVIDKNESPLQAAVRETREEVGLAITRESVKFMCVYYEKSDLRDLYKFVFRSLIDDEVAGKIALDHSEIEAYDFVSKEQVRKNENLYSTAIQAWAKGKLAGYIENKSKYPPRQAASDQGATDEQ